MMTEKYDRSIWKNIGDISICENTTGIRGKNMTGTCGENMIGTCEKIWQEHVEKIIIMATGTYEKIDDVTICEKIRQEQVK